MTFSIVSVNSGSSVITKRKENCVKQYCDKVENVMNVNVIIVKASSINSYEIWTNLNGSFAFTYIVPSCARNMHFNCKFQLIAFPYFFLLRFHNRWFITNIGYRKKFISITAVKVKLMRRWKQR